MLQISSIAYTISGRPIFKDASASINAGHKVGLVGSNGIGKSTLFRLILNPELLDGGEIFVPPRWRVGMTSQEAPGGPERLVDVVLAADTERAALLAEEEACQQPERLAEIHARLTDIDAHSAPARAAQILAGLGFDEEAQQRPCSDYSGGWRMRVALAALLFTQPDLLLLDEPTNHLDLEAALWLEQYIRKYPGTVLLISHDRGLLNRTVGEILHVENLRLNAYSGNYDRFERVRRERMALQAKARDRQLAERERIQAFITRFRAKASKARQAQSRVKMLERMEPIAAVSQDSSSTFIFPTPDSLSSPLYTMDDVSIGYNDTPVLKKLNLRLDSDDRIALLGANGNGKSTLIKLLASELRAMSGLVQKSKKLKVGYFAQHQGDALDLNITALETMKRLCPRDVEEKLRSHLAGFGFDAVRAETKIGKLSGGEKARLLFAIISREAPHILLLDEPTNHLDIDGRQALVQAINAYDGAVVMVSHDPHLIEATADRLWLVHGGRAQPFDGDMEDYRKFLVTQRREQQRAKAPARTGKANDDEGGDKASLSAADRQAQRRAAADQRKALAPLKKDLERCEAKVERLTAQRGELEAKLQDPALYEQADQSKAIALQKQVGELSEALEAAELAWMEALEVYEGAQEAAQEAA